MVAPITIGPGITLGAGVSVGPPGHGGTAGVNGTLGYAQMGGAVVPGFQLEDGSATVNNPVGFTINDGFATGVAMPSMTPSNIAFFSTYGTGNKTVYFGPGSSSASGTVYLDNVNGSIITFFMPSVGTYNYPFTFA